MFLEKGVAGKDIAEDLTKLIKVGLTTVTVTIGTVLGNEILRGDTSSYVSALESLKLDTETATIGADALVAFTTYVAWQRATGTPVAMQYFTALALEIFSAVFSSISLALGASKVSIPDARAALAVESMGFATMAFVYSVSPLAQGERVAANAFPMGTLTQVGAGLSFYGGLQAAQSAGL